MSPNLRYKRLTRREERIKGQAQSLRERAEAGEIGALRELWAKGYNFITLKNGSGMDLIGKFGKRKT